MAGILIYSEKTNLAAELLTAAGKLGEGQPIGAVSINDEVQVQDLSNKGAAVYRVNNSGVSVFDTWAVADALRQAVTRTEAGIILLASNRRGKELAGRLAQVLEAGCLTDVLSLNVQEGKITCVRNALGGATLAVQSIQTAKAVLAIVPKVFEAAKEQGDGRIIDLEIETMQNRVRLVESRAKPGDGADIENAEVVVAVGMGADQEDLRLASQLAALLGGEVGCSKPVATDRKWLSEERLIGLSGKKCKPRLAIALGISGQVQFMVGLREAKVLVAVNSDENANIMQMADYKMAARIKDVLPELTAQLLTLS